MFGTIEIERMSKKLHKWYLEACEEIEVKPKKLTKEQEAINRVITRKIIENILRELTLTEADFDSELCDSEESFRNFKPEHIYIIMVEKQKQGKIYEWWAGRRLRVYKKLLGKGE